MSLAFLVDKISLALLVWLGKEVQVADSEDKRWIKRGATCDLGGHRYAKARTGRASM